MRRILLEPRPDWKSQAEHLGFRFHTMYGQPYWDESRAWGFSLAEIEDRIEDPTYHLEKMTWEAVDCVAKDNALMLRMGIHPGYLDAVRESWARQDRNLYGRFDLFYDGQGPAKLYEYNADTPTSLFESAIFQWQWLEDHLRLGSLPVGTDQFNSLHEKLVDAFARYGFQGPVLHMASFHASEEDRGTVQYLRDCAEAADLKTLEIDVDDIGIDAAGRLTDASDQVITDLFKLVPWEDIAASDYGARIAKLSRKGEIRIVEPAWKMILSNKAILPVLWEMFEGHPNLLPAWFADDPRRPWEALSEGYVVKPFFSREGANVELRPGEESGDAAEIADGPYSEGGRIVQAYRPPHREGDDYMVIGSWIVAGQPAGIGIREDSSRITKNLSRFVPHFIESNVVAPRFSPSLERSAS